MNPYKSFLAYFNKLHGEAYKKKSSKKLIQKIKIGHLNDNDALLKNNEKKKKENNFLKNYVKNK